MSLSPEKHFKDKLAIYPLFWLAYLYFGYIGYSFKWKKKINFKPEIKPCIYAIWHGQQYSLLNFLKHQYRKNINILISNSNDGEGITRACHRLGFSVIRGSHKRGGSKAARQLVKALKRGENVAYTVDGPKGPIYKVKEGIIRIAQMSGAPIIPISSTGGLAYRANSWDDYEMPLPFAKPVSVFGDPIYVPRDADENEIERIRKLLEDELIALYGKAREEYRKK